MDDGIVRGLRCYIYRPAHGDCSNGGLSGRVNEVTLVGDGIPRIFAPTADAPDVELGSILGSLHARPAGGVVPGMVGPMFGGCFIYSSDSRFPSSAPIALHDRFESPELATAMHN